MSAPILSPAGIQYVQNFSAHHQRVATAKCQRCGDQLYAGGQPPVPSHREPLLFVCVPCAADETARKPTRRVQPGWDERCREVAQLAAIRAAAAAEAQAERDARRAPIAQPGGAS